jgi:hypothetical protein
MKNYLAYFVVELDGDADSMKEAGFYPANSFSEVVKVLEEYYGDDLIAIHHLELLDCCMMTMKPDEAANIVANIL